MKNTIALYLIAFGVAVIALQNAGIIPPVKAAISHLDSTVPITARIDGTVPVTGSVNIANTVSVQGSVEVDKPVSLSAPVDVNLSAIVGRQLVESQSGMYIGINSVSNTVIPIHWGEITVDGSVSVDNTVDVRGSVDVDNTVDIQGAVDVDGSVEIDNVPGRPIDVSIIPRF
jgi:hypothetical protein